MNATVHIAATSLAARRLHEARKKSVSITDKVVPRNPKYANVKSTLNTGKHVGNIKPPFDTSGEIFKRIKRGTLNNMMEWKESKGQEHFGDTVSTVSTMTVDTENKETYENYDYLLLDVRDPEYYLKCHIMGAVNYPAIKLRRDQYIPEIYAFKNKADKVIILYDNDGYSKLGIDIASMFVQKLFNNVVLLSGGISALAEKYPHRIWGQLPDELVIRPDTARSTASIKSRTSICSRSSISGKMDSSAQTIGSSSTRRPYTTASSVSSRR